MKIQIRPRGVTLTSNQHARMERDVDILLARFGDRIDRVTVAISEADDAGCTCCEIEVRLKPDLVKVEHSDPDVDCAVTHAVERAARAVGRAIETAVLIRR